MEEPLPIVPHEFLGADCCGCLCPIVHGNEAALLCNECGEVVATVLASDVERTLLEMAMKGGICSATCPHCGAVNTFIGFSSMQAYVCKECGAGVDVPMTVQ